MKAEKSGAADALKTPKKGKKVTRKYKWTAEQIARRVETQRLKREAKKALGAGHAPDVAGAISNLRRARTFIVARVRSVEFKDFTEIEVAVLSALKDLQGRG